MYDYSPLGKISSQTSTNGSCQITRKFQQKIDDLFHGFEIIRAYINDLLVLTKGNLTEYVCILRSGTFRSAIIRSDHVRSEPFRSADSK